MTNNNENNNTKFKFAIDRGGTFTDCFAITPANKILTLKLLSKNPTVYNDAPTYAIRKIISEELNVNLHDKPLIDPEYIEWIRMGTTVATNALLESKGERFCLVITKGFKDLLYIGNQSRPNLFDLSIQMPNILYEHVIEVEERVTPSKNGRLFNETSRVKLLDNNEKIEILTELNLLKLEQDLRDLVEHKKIRNIAVLLMHSYVYNDHEVQIEMLAKKLGIKSISLSHKISPMVRAVPRGLTTCIDAYLTPCIKEYLESFRSSFSGDVNVLFMQSDGGLTSYNDFTGCRAILSGPAGGVVGYAITSYDEELNEPIIGFDMGGTSTDVSRYAGKYEHVFETITAGYSIQTPQLDINTIAAGGGSKLFFHSMFVVGPESAGSYPGPACYRNNGPLTITDANLILGRLQPDYFPRIFGPNQDELLSYEASLKLFKELTVEINKFQVEHNLKEMTIEQVALGYIRVANEAMCRPIRNLTEGKGYDTRKHVLACFGGAGGQHACAIARALGIKKLIVNKYSGILSAYGLSLADVVHEEQEPCNLQLTQSNIDNYILKRITQLKQICSDYLVNREKFAQESVICEVYLNLRFEGTDTGIMTESLEMTSESYEKVFIAKYKKEYGFTLSRRIFVDDIWVRGIGKTNINKKSLPAETRLNGKLEPNDQRTVYFDGAYMSTNVYKIEDIIVGDKITGPALIMDKNSTILVEPKCFAYLNKTKDVVIELEELNQKSVEHGLDIIQLSVFSHRFMSIAEQMGRILQRTAVSTNIKERLDYSCAMFDSQGHLVANAPHIPVHLGAMQEAVKYQIRNTTIKRGDVILSNHPGCGGSHLPDLTVITPVFNSDVEHPVFFVANRGHHADIGGMSPGSMPPNSTKLWQEGAVFKSTKIVKDDVFMEQDIIDAFNQPAIHPGCAGSRNLSDNLSDLKAQIAANQKGIDLINQLIEEYSLEVVLSYMKYIQQTAEQSVRLLMKEMSLLTDHTLDEFSYLGAVDRMDDNTRIKLLVKINKLTGSAVFDFTGTGYQVNGNCNTPRAITLSAIIYCLRTMLKHDVPLNQGCLKPIEIIIPKSSILNPSEDAAVVGGNVLTSQRIVDVIFKAFKVCAASQGCMNNITIGNEKGGYYETVGGGAGAGPNWNGRSGVHTHMTNTRITDVEIVENRYPFMIKTFSLRNSSGGKGRNSGGNGLIREYLFKDDLNLCVLTERRVFQPYGLDGGEPGANGLNTLETKEGLLINLGSKSEIKVKLGDVFRLETPGGGGYGHETKNHHISNEDDSNSNSNLNAFKLQTGSLYTLSQIQNSA